MSYCLNPTCPHPENLTPDAEQCQYCGFPLLLHQRYRVLKTLGKGGFGTTFLVKDETLLGKPNCVVKQLRSFANESEDLQQSARKLFEREATTLYKIGNHPQVPRLLNYFEDSQRLYLVEEYISGSTLQQEVKRSGPFSETKLKQFLNEFLPLLQYIHEQQVIHRDIKPANLIRREQDGKIVLIDFGAVKKQIKNEPEETTLTANVVGTRGFAPPEQMAKRPVYASDIYALGVTCICLLTGKSPKDFDYNSLTGAMLWQHKVQVSDHLAKVLRKMLEVSVRHRYQSADEVLKILEFEPCLNNLIKRKVAQRFSSFQQTVNQTKLNSGDSGNPSGGGYFYNRSVAQVAAEIRAKRAKLAAIASSKPEMTAHQLLMSKPSGATTRKKATAQASGVLRNLDSDSLLSAYVKGRRNFALHDLSRLNLQQADLQSANFHSSKLDRINLQGANLFSSNFGRASLNQANLRNANLSRAYLSQANLEAADLRSTDLSYADLTNANLRGANLCGANLSGAKLSQEMLALAKTNWLTVQPSGKRGLL